MMQHSVITLYQDRDELIQEAAVSLASPELTVILLTRPTSFRGWQAAVLMTPRVSTATVIITSSSY